MTTLSRVCMRVPSVGDSSAGQHANTESLMARTVMSDHHAPVAAQWTTLVVDALDPESLARFWANALRWDQHATDPTDGSVVVADPDHRHPILLFLPTQETKSQKNRVHLDLNPIGCDQDEERER
jgi:hypothetical protein